MGFLFVIVPFLIFAGAICIFVLIISRFVMHARMSRRIFDQAERQFDREIQKQAESRPRECAHCGTRVVGESECPNCGAPLGE